MGEAELIGKALTAVVVAGLCGSVLGGVERLPPTLAIGLVETKLLNQQGGQT